MEQSEHRHFKDVLFHELARPARALANAHRLEIIDLLAQAERSVEELAGLTHMSVANTSQHLQILRAAGLVDRTRVGSFVHYRLAGEDVFVAWQALRSVGERRVAEVDRIVATYLQDRGQLTPVSATDLQALLREGTVTVLDVRPEEEFRAGHIPGAKSIPVAQLEARLTELPEDQEVVAYCRGPYCVFADEAVQLLLAHGRRARRLVEGLPDWRAAGLPVVDGPDPSSLDRTAVVDARQSGS